MLKIIIDKKVKYVILTLVFLIILSLVVNAFIDNSFTHDTWQIVNNDFDLLDADANYVFDKSDETLSTKIQYMEHFPVPCLDNEFPIAISDDGNFICYSFEEDELELECEGFESYTLCNVTWKNVN